MIAGLTASHSDAIWYLMRGTGLVALLLLTLTLAAGIVGVQRWSSPGWPRTVVNFVHRNVALLAVVFLTVHVTSAIIDPYVSIDLLAAVVPLASHWHSFRVGLGALSLDVMLALVVTSLVRARIGHRTWRAVHWLAYASWPLALVHGFSNGTDSHTVWARAVYVAAIAVIAVALTWRLARPTPPGLIAPRVHDADPWVPSPPVRDPDGRAVPAGSHASPPSGTRQPASRRPTNRPPPSRQPAKADS